MEGDHHDYPERARALGIAAQNRIPAPPSVPSRGGARALAVPGALNNLSHVIERLVKTAAELASRLDASGVLRPPAPNGEKAVGVPPCTCGLQGAIDERAIQIVALTRALQELLERLEV